MTNQAKRAWSNSRVVYATPSNVQA